ncbi:MAG: ribbon-helix-helix domain-containing protein [Candidatus Lokiarchaeota archaeon]|nr:ribbon-helix-helix domain-containing protein [Candidatus Harpocratesius repetitus]
MTVNLPVSYLKAIDSLTGQEGLYPSRSELIRVAVRDFLIRELETAKSFQKYQQTQVPNKITHKPLDENMFVQVPVNENSINGVTEYKTYRLIKK